MSTSQELLDKVITEIKAGEVKAIEDIYTSINSSLEDLGTDLNTLVDSLAKNKSSIHFNKKTNVYLAIFNKAINYLDLDAKDELTLKQQAFSAFKTQQLKAESNILSLQTSNPEINNYKKFIAEKIKQVNNIYETNFNNFEKLLDALDNIYLSGKSISAATKTIDKEIVASIKAIGLTDKQVSKFLNDRTINKLLVTKDIAFYSRIDSTLDLAFNNLQYKKQTNAKSKATRPGRTPNQVKDLRNRIQQAKDNLTYIEEESITSIQPDISQIINQYLFEYIKQRMNKSSDPSSLEYLRFQKGRFAKSAKVQNTSLDMIQYSFMNMPYDTFVPGRGKKGLDSEGRNPKRYIELSIRDIIKDKVLSEFYNTPIKEL